MKNVASGAELEKKIEKTLKIEDECEKKLIQELQTKEAELKRVKIEKKKLIKNRDQAKVKYEKIKKRKTWRYMKLLRKFIDLIKYLIRDETETYAQFSKKNTLNRNKSSSIVEQDLHKKLIEAKENGKILECLDYIARKRKEIDKKYISILKNVAKMYINSKSETKNEIFKKVLSSLKIEELPEFIVRTVQKEKLGALNDVSSFRVAITMRSRKVELGDFGPEWTLNNKIKSYAFIDEIGIKRPKVFGEQLSFSDVPRVEGIVIKPSQGANSSGVYLVINEEKIIDVKRSRILNNWDLLDNYIKNDLDSGIVRDKWIVEELVFEDKKKERPARDLKFYCFYGEVALILEIVRFPEKRYCWWTPKGDRIFTGKYKHKLFKGEGVSRSQIELASSISLKIPAPFIRIDFLKTQNGLIFGEFTPRPGNYDQFNNPTDQMMGDYFLKAEGRLVSDLLNGKHFTEYKNYVNQLNR